MPDAEEMLTRLQVELDALRRRVSELEEERARLQHDGAELEAIYREAPVGLCLIDRDLRFVRVSERVAELSGQPGPAHVGRRIGEILPDLAEAGEALVLRVIRGGEPVVNRELRRGLASEPSLRRRWRVDCHPVRASDGSITGAIAVIQDVTLLKETANELKRAQEHLTQALRIAGVGSWEWDLVRDRVWWSGEIYRILGRQQGFFTPSFEAFMEHVHPEDRPRIRKQLDATFNDDEPYVVEFRAVRSDGEIRVVRAHAELTRAADGTALRLVGTGQDLTLETGSG